MKKYFIGVLCILMLISIFSCKKGDASPSENNSGNGTGGSMARFTLSGDHLYMINDQDLHVFDLQIPARPRPVNRITVGSGMETIFARGNTLFMGSGTGMYIYSLTDPSNPFYLSQYNHIRSCDPVVADDHYAYVTLRSENSRCGGFNNQLDVIDINNLRNPKLVRTYLMSNPRGLGKDGNLLFICDEGLKVYNASNVMNLSLQNYFQIEAHDVIPINGNLMVIGDDGLYQYNYSGSSINLLSKLNIIKTN